MATGRRRNAPVVVVVGRKGVELLLSLERRKECNFCLFTVAGKNNWRVVAELCKENGATGDNKEHLLLIIDGELKVLQMVSRVGEGMVKRWSE